MARTRTPTPQPKSAPLTVPQAARHLGGLVRQARLAHLMTMQTLAQDARVSLATVKRIEAGSLGVSMGGWLAVFKAASLLQRVASLRDPIAKSVGEGTGARRGGRRRPFANEDYDNLDSDA